MIFGHAVIAWIFFLIFYYCKILNFGLLKVRFGRKKHKDVKDDGTSEAIVTSQLGSASGCTWGLGYNIYSQIK